MNPCKARMNLTLGQKIRGVREAKRLDPDDLAERVGLNRSTLSRYESDSIDPPAMKLKAIATALEIRAGYLLGEIPEFEQITPREVAVRESLRLFLAHRSISKRKQKGFWRSIDLPQAPTSVQGWKELDELLHRILGKKV